MRQMCVNSQHLTYLLVSLPEFQTAEAPVKHIAEHDRQLQREEHSSDSETKTKHSHNARPTRPTLSSSQKALCHSLCLSLSERVTSSLPAKHIHLCADTHTSPTQPNPPTDTHTTSAWKTDSNLQLYSKRKAQIWSGLIKLLRISQKIWCDSPCKYDWRYRVNSAPWNLQTIRLKLPVSVISQHCGSRLGRYRQKEQEERVGIQRKSLWISHKQTLIV